MIAGIVGIMEAIKSFSNQTSSNPPPSSQTSDVADLTKAFGGLTFFSPFEDWIVKPYPISSLNDLTTLKEEQFKNITAIQLKVPRIIDLDTMKKLGRALQKFTKLESLDISIPYLRVPGSTMFLTIVRDQDTINSACICSLFNHLSLLAPNLRNLKVDWPHEDFHDDTGEGLKSINDFLSRCQKLKSLDLRKGLFSAIHLKELRPYLECCPLEKLAIPWSSLPFEQSIPSILEWRGLKKTLKVLIVQTHDNRGSGLVGMSSRASLSGIEPSLGLTLGPTITPAFNKTTNLEEKVKDVTLRGTEKTGNTRTKKKKNKNR